MYIGQSGRRFKNKTFISTFSWRITINAFGRYSFYSLLASFLTEWFCFLHISAPHSGSSMMNMFWSFFVSSLTKEGIPEYVLRVYRSKFFQLPWQSFIPTLHNMQLMQEVCCFFSENLRFLPFKK